MAPARDADTPRIALREELRPEDAAVIEALVRATGRFSPAEVAIAAELVEEGLRSPQGDYRFVVADRDGRVAGYSCYGAIPGTRTSFDLYWIAVDPPLQGCGLGRRLLAWTERSIAGLGGRRVWVDTSGRPDYAPTRAFYGAAGYRVEATLADFYADGDDKVIFVKLLSPAGRGESPPGEGGGA
jgi:ribosomal protein S18 acetylase RimI-like enzyme